MATKILHNSFFQKKTLVILSVSIITSLLCLQSLQAEPLPQRGPIPFNSYDLNSNGSISQDEFNTIRGLRMENRAAQGFPMRNMASEPNFIQFDMDKDGQLNPDELARGQQLQRQKMQGQRMGIGRGKDRLLTPEEFSLGMQQHMQNRQSIGRRQGRGMNRGRNMPKFSDFDMNNDGYITEQELIEARSMRISKRIQQGYQMRNTGNIVQFQEIDKNSDGKISPEEFSTQQQKHQMKRQRP